MNSVRRLLAASAAMAVALLACGCSRTSGPGTSVCLPSPLHLSAKYARAGSELIVSSGPFTCDARYAAGKKYRLTLILTGRASPIDLGTVPVNRDGSLRAAVTLPSAAPPGRAVLWARGSAYDQCTDGASSCAAYAVEFTLRPGGTAQAADPAAGPYAASIIALAEQMRGPLPRARILYIVDHTCAGVASSPPTAQTCEPGLIGAKLRRDLAAALRGYAAVQFIADPAGVTGPGPGLIVDHGGIVVTLGPIQLAGAGARVPVAVRRSGLDGRGMTYLLTEQGGQWNISRARGPAWIS